MPDRSDQILEKIKIIESKLLEENYSESEYKDLMQTAGISNSDYIHLRESLNDYIERGNSFLRHKMPEKALSEFKNALLIKPDHLDTLLGLSESFLELIKIQFDKNYADAIDKYAYRCLKIDPDNPTAVKIIQNLKKIKSDHKKNRGNRPALTLAYIIISLFVITVLAFLYGEGKKLKNKNEPLPTIIPKIKKTPDQNNGKKTLKFPVEFIKNHLSADFDFELRHSEAVHYEFSESYYYTMRAFLIPKNKICERAILQFEALDSIGNIIISDKIFPKIPNREGRPGDLLPVYKIQNDEKIIPKIEKIRVRLLETEMKAVLSKFPESKEIVFKGNKPDGLEIMERFSKIAYNNYSKDNLHSLTLEVKNTGGRPIKNLEVNLFWYDPSGNIINNRLLNLIQENNLVLNPGDQIPYDTVMGIKNSKSAVKLYKIEIIEIKY